MKQKTKDRLDGIGYIIYAIFTFLAVGFCAYMYGMKSTNENIQKDSYEQGFKDGQKDVLDSQIITSKDKQEGNFISEYKGNTYFYWYEEMK